MKLSRLYSNYSEIFSPIEFNNGLSVILAEIRIPANRDLDTHNLGKTTVGELIDYCLLKGKSGSFFLYKREASFSEFVFFIEIELLDGSFVTVARPVTPGSRISFKRSSQTITNASTLSASDWDHFSLPFDRAKQYLDGVLDLQALPPWKFRQLVGYLIRSQRDYFDVFQLSKFSGKHQEWKPFVAHLIGLGADSVVSLYEKREEMVGATTRLHTLVQEYGQSDVGGSVIDALIAVKRRDVDAISNTLESFDFNLDDRKTTTDTVDNIEKRIAGLNESRYRAFQMLSRLSESLEEERINFRTEDAEALFRESGVVFGIRSSESSTS